MPSTGGPKLECHSVVGVHTTEDLSEVFLFGGANFDGNFANPTIYTFGMSKSTLVIGYRNGSSSSVL